MADCSTWEENYSDSKLWEDEKDLEAARRVITREKARLAERLKPHYGNTVWEKRKSPPEDWNKQLPKFMLERQKDSYLTEYVRGKENSTEAGRSSETLAKDLQSKAVNATTPACTIM